MAAFAEGMNAGGGAALAESASSSCICCAARLCVGRSSAMADGSIGIRRRDLVRTSPADVCTAAGRSRHLADGRSHSISRRHERRPPPCERQQYIPYRSARYRQGRSMTGRPRLRTKLRPTDSTAALLSSSRERTAVAR